MLSPTAQPAMTWERLEKAAPICSGARPGRAARSQPSTRRRAGRARRSSATPPAPALLDALVGTDRSAGLAYLTGLAAGYAQHTGEVSVETCGAGPARITSPCGRPPRCSPTWSARPGSELLLMTYSARQYPPLTDVLRAAIGRGVPVSVVVETLQGAGSALSGDEPYQAFTGINGIELWHWPTTKRTEPGAKMHAKLAVADRHILLSPALTSPSPASPRTSKPACSSEADRPVRAAEHVDALRAAGAFSASADKHRGLPAASACSITRSGSTVCWNSRRPNVRGRKQCQSS